MAKFMLGNIRHSLDDKGRMRIPAKFRENLGAAPYAVPGRIGCLYIVPEEKFEKIIESLGADNLYKNDASSDISTSVLGSGDELSEDGQGRVRLSKELCRVANIDKDIVFVGKGSYLEIWPAEAWDARFSVLNPENLNKVLENLKKFGV